PFAAAGERLERERAGPRVQVEDVAALEELAEDIEHRAADLVAGRAGRDPARRGAPPAARAARGAPRHLPPPPTRRRRPAARAPAEPLAPSPSTRSVVSA